MAPISILDYPVGVLSDTLPVKNVAFEFPQVVPSLAVDEPAEALHLAQLPLAFVHVVEVRVHPAPEAFWDELP